MDLDDQNASGQTGGPGTYTIQFGVSDAPADEGADIDAVKDGYVSVTPLEADRDLDGATEGWLRTILIGARPREAGSSRRSQSTDTVPDHVD